MFTDVLYIAHTSPIPWPCHAQIRVERGVAQGERISENEEARASWSGWEVILVDLGPILDRSRRKHRRQAYANSGANS